MKLRCPRCKKKLAVPDKFAGKTIRCPACNRAMTVPTPKAALGGAMGQSDLDLEGLAEQEVHTSQMSQEELSTAVSNQEARKAAQSVTKHERVCPHCHTRTKIEDPHAEILCSYCWKTIPALDAAAVEKERRSSVQQAPHSAGAVGFYGELASSVTYPLPAISSLLIAAVVAFLLALAPVVMMTSLTNLMQQSEVGTEQGVQQGDLTGVQTILIGIFAAEVFFFFAMAIHTFFEVVRATSIRDNRPPMLAFSPNQWGKSFFSYLLLGIYYVGMTYLVAKITVKGNIPNYVANGDVSGLLQAGGTPFIVGMIIISFFIPMNLLGTSLGSIIQAINPVNVVKSVANTHAHYVFLVLILVVYGGFFGYTFSAILFDWFIPQISTMFSGSVKGNYIDVALPMLAWGAVMAFFFYGTYILARLHGLFARSFRKDLLFGAA